VGGGWTGFDSQTAKICLEMKLISLFAGIGGFDLAAHWMGWESILLCEWDKWNQALLKKRFPGVPVHGDIKTLTHERIKEYIGNANSDELIISGGFPCQPFSSAGKREGTNDDRYLWPEMLRVIREVQPAWVVGENVAGILSMDDGRVIDEVQTSLESEGYAVQSFVIPACAVKAVHRRDRVWIVANNQKTFISKQPPTNKGRENRQFAHNGNAGDAANAKQRGEQGQRRPGYAISTTEARKRQANSSINELLRLTESPVCGTDDGLSRGVDKPRHRKRRLEGLGNAIVPQVAYEIFGAIELISKN
jgi:DNA (cytosine-5)-methyltransferase 1